MGQLFDDAVSGLRQVLDDHEARDAQLAADTAATIDRLTGELTEAQQDLATANARIRELEAAQQPTPGPGPQLMLGTYEGHFSASKVKTNIGSLPQVANYYGQTATDGTPNALPLAKFKAEIDEGVAPIIDLDYKQSAAVSVANVAAGKADAALKSWLDDLATVADYAKAQGLEAWFSFVHEAIVHINQKNFAAAVPTTTQMADAWDRVMGMARDRAPDAVRTYWFGGMEAKVGGVAGGVAHGDQLDASLLQATTFDPYRFKSRPDTQTPQETFGPVVDALKARPWSKGKPWGLTEYGSDKSHGDANNALWITQAVKYLRDEGATLAVYFDRQNGDRDYRITDGTQPKALAAYKAAVIG